MTELRDTACQRNPAIIEPSAKTELHGLMSIFWTQKVKLFYAALLANNSH